MTRSTDLPRPSNEQDFENLCLDLFEVLWDTAAPFGRRGHEQLGIDIFGETAEGPVAAQCKKREGKLTAADVDRDAGKAGALDPKLKRLIFVTTAARDPKLQKHVRARNAAKKLGFPLELSPEQQTQLLRAWAEHGPQGPIDDEGVA